MKRAMSNLSPEEIGQLALRFAPEGMLEAPVPFGGGHINDTYLFSPAGEKGVRYVLQRINSTASVSYTHLDVYKRQQQGSG